MDYKVVDLQSGKYDCDTLFVQVDTEIIQVPVSKKVNVANDIVGKLITIDNLYAVPLDNVAIVTAK